MRGEGEKIAGSNTVVNIIEQRGGNIDIGNPFERARSMKISSVQGVVTNTGVCIGVGGKIGEPN